MLSEGEVGRVDQLPQVPVLIYDGRCGFCSRWVGRVRAWDRAAAVRYLPLQDAGAPDVAGRQREALQQALHLVRPDGVVFAGAAAARELLGYLPGGRIPKVVLNLPGVRWLAAKSYSWIARRFGPVVDGTLVGN